MSMSLFSPARTVLMISDEFMSVYTVDSKGVRLHETIPCADEGAVASVSSVLAKDCGGRPVLILNDMVEQHYRKERVLKSGVGFTDKAALLNRKLTVAFPNSPIRAAYALKEKIAKTDKQPASSLYIFAAVSNSEQLSKAISAVRESMVSLAGFCLLPVESSDMVSALSEKLAKSSKSPARWTIYMGQHRNGNLRQIVTRNGELALTRMSPVLDTEEDHQAWATQVHQEFKATMSYLSRFGYHAEDGLDVIIVAGAESGDLLENMIDESCNLHIMTVMQAAEVLGLRLGKQDSLRYADPLHVAWGGRKKKFILPMRAASIDAVSRPRQIAAVFVLCLFLGGVFQGYQLLDITWGVTAQSQNLNEMKEQKAQLDSQYERETERINKMGFDVRLVQSAIAVDADFEKNRIRVLDLVTQVAKALGKDLRIDLLEVKRASENPIETFVNGVSPPQPLFQARLRMTYPATANVDSGNKEVRELSERLTTLLPGHKVEVLKYLKDYEYTEGLVVKTGDLEKENIQQDFVAEILIKSPAVPADEGAGQ